ncbi:MAG TPA: tRNA pseudouridine(55) synthase TruB [Leptospiraceae bacterium]|nr:tRNA pseudouridine(55) synthase TruB [Leptospiraceae bacterium]HMY69424.1 tRNA pseudouridine(55) synthase TruB [Leptospiraceae bacterium]HMZ58571.1 tRNA pseudouridine(55) synthase TruB [Leptospiraceae bacterium]HNF16214.1 tRNA pseudouridine(55) synthase TruB [Leptospiraceae bacterium]HNF26969.1 tRNA pseudouridine(55) synthase TruB [Leptospiraceae bacterium]
MNPDSGFFIADKPSGITSSDFVLKIKKTVKIKKIGHTGTLDKFASGLMILPFGDFTCFASIFSECSKTYTAEVRFGKTTDSGDREGTLIEEWESERTKEFAKQNRERIEEEFNSVIGWKEQIPPKISALKVNGQRQSDLFRKNISFESKPRPIQIFSFSILEFSETGLKFRTEVSAGTYIRKIAADVSEKLGFPMHLVSLVRETVGRFSLSDADNLERLAGNPRVYTAEEMIDWKRIPAADTAWIRHGKKKTEYFNVSGDFFFTDEKGNILAWCYGDGKEFHYKKVFIRNFTF